MTITAEQQELVDAVGRVLSADTGVEAAWLAGSLGKRQGDSFSDVDVLVLVADDRGPEVIARYCADVSEIAEPGLVNPLYGGRVLNVVTADWRRFDLSFIEGGDLGRYDAAALTPIFNKTGRSPPYAVSAPPYRTTPETLSKLVNEFLRVLGLLVVAIGREEYVLGLTGADLLRRMTVDLMLEENDIGPVQRGGALHRNPLLTPEQREALAALAPIAANRAGIISANIALAELFLPRARRLAARIGMAWPEGFEASTRRHLKGRLGVVFG